MRVLPGILALSLLCGLAPARGGDIAPSAVAQTGQAPAAATAPGMVILANEPGVRAGCAFEFDLGSYSGTATPLARLKLLGVEKCAVKRPGQQAPAEKGVLQAFHHVNDAWKLLASLPMKGGGVPTDYLLDVTKAVNAALARTDGPRTLRIEVRLEGKPLAYEVYRISSRTENPAAVLEIAGAAGWTDDWEQRVERVDRSPVVYRESCLPLAETRSGGTVLKLLYPAAKILEVSHPASGKTYQEGRDWTLRGGTLFLPEGTQVPVQIAAEFFTAERKDKNGAVTSVQTAVRLVPGAWYHDRQIAVTYEPSGRDWEFPAPVSSIDQLPRLKKLFAEKAPVRVLLFGDSISAGGDCSALLGVPPYQPDYGTLVVRKLASHYGSEITLINPSRAGATSEAGAKQVDAQAAAFLPDLAIIAFGMNDRAPERQPHFRENIEKIIDAIRAKSPGTEFLIVTPMLNNPKQPAGLGPVQSIRDEALKISRAGLAFADVTSTHLAMIAHKDYLDLSGNGANHPNDFLHRIYAQRILEVLVPDELRGE